MPLGGNEKQNSRLWNSDLESIAESQYFGYEVGEEMYDMTLLYQSKSYAKLYKWLFIDIIPNSKQYPRKQRKAYGGKGK